ncbi:ATP-dependent helicase ['Fragaria x ananassa' phyllody phytoplasma]|uniref:ATP-dependent helicase n=1 Tax='Fragaria x ananassa' phyllody phytoplasma TaxID=2358428 RepID=A0ABS5K3I6_9MOLU|nr:UvrD-helicase domain-containing protein ['Fragaria x ananassa' phyllody phytoplasma]MBS2126466.1 ATP-dependent helicase ['Fragaria x ananassa' phyllody phytoplasma]
MKQLNKKQLQIIRYNKGSLNIVAGTGTGKTTILIERVKYLINKLKILPKNILILSFNKNTVNDIYKCFPIDIKIMTFHVLSTSILKKNIDLLNNKYNCNFKIMDELETEYAIKNVLKSGIKLYQYISSFSNIRYTISKIKKKI